MGPQRVVIHLDWQRERPLQPREQRLQLLEDGPDVWERRGLVSGSGDEGLRERIPRLLVDDARDKCLLVEGDGLI